MLHLYMSLDHALPKAGYLKVSLPSTLTHVFTTCNAWKLGTTLKAPKTGLIVGTVSTGYCTFASDLSANTAYGVALGRTAATGAEGVHAPIGLQTRMNALSNNGPVLDNNPVFDSAVVLAAAGTMTVTVAKTTATTAKVYPGESYTTLWTFDFSSLGANTVIPVPYDIVLTLGKPTGKDRIQSVLTTATAWVKYPHTYGDWTWTATCTNKVHGKPNAAKPADSPKMTGTPKCAIDATNKQKLTISVTDAKDGIAKTATVPLGSFSMSFEIPVKNPSDLIGVSPKASAKICNPTMEVYALYAAADASDLKVTKPAATNGKIDVLLSFGVNPETAVEIKKGVAIYSLPFALVKGSADGTILAAVWVADKSCNLPCKATANDNVIAPHITNAIEFDFKIPMAVPNDRTMAAIDCKDDDAAADHLTVFGSSVSSKSWGKTGSCFFRGK